MNLAAASARRSSTENAHLTLERAPRLSVADMTRPMTARRGLRVAAPAAAVALRWRQCRHHPVLRGRVYAGPRLGLRRVTGPRRRPVKTRPDSCPVKVPLTHLHVLPRWSGPQSRRHAERRPGARIAA